MENLPFIIVILIRLVVPLSILRWPLAGGLLAIVADATDIMIFQRFGIGSIGWADYSAWDKAMDMYYLTLELYVAMHWKDILAKRTAIWLYIWRFAGFATFDFMYFIYGMKLSFLLVLAPNIFENFYLCWVAILHYFPEFKLNNKRLAVILIVATIPKMTQELIMHYWYSDQVWGIIRTNLLWWLYN